ILASTCSMRLATLTTVKLSSRLLTALNLEPSRTTTARVNRLSFRHSTTNCAQAARMAGPLSRRKSAIVLKSGLKRPVSHSVRGYAGSLVLISGWRNAVAIAAEIDREQSGRMIRRPSRGLRHHAGKVQSCHVQFVNVSLNDAYGIVWRHIFVQTHGQQCRLPAALPFNET